MKKKDSARRSSARTARQGSSAAQKPAARQVHRRPAKTRVSARSVKVATRAAEASRVARLDGSVPVRRELYPAIEPFRQGHLRVSDIHEIYYEE